MGSRACERLFWPLVERATQNVAPRQRRTGAGVVRVPVDCLLGGLGQELSGMSDIFRVKIEECFSAIQQRIALCLGEAQAQGSIPADSDPDHMAGLLVNCWEGAALRSRLRGSAAPLASMLDFYFGAIVAP